MTTRRGFIAGMACAAIAAVSPIGIASAGAMPTTAIDDGIDPMSAAILMMIVDMLEKTPPGFMMAVRLHDDPFIWYPHRNHLPDRAECSSKGIVVLDPRQAAELRQRIAGLRIERPLRDADRGDWIAA